MTTIRNVNQQPAFRGLKPTSKGNEIMNKVPEFVDKIKSSVNIDDVYSYLDKCSQGTNSVMKKLESNIYQYKDYFIRIGMSFNTDGLAQTLKDLNKLDLSCAPKYVASKYFEDGSAILITRIKSFNSDLPLRTYNSAKSEVSIEAKSEFLKDIDKLLKNDTINPEILKSTQNWYVIPGSNKIYIDNWGELEPVYSSSDKRNCKKIISDMCGMIYD